MDIDDSKVFTNVSLFYMKVMTTITSPDYLMKMEIEI